MASPRPSQRAPFGPTLGLTVTLAVAAFAVVMPVVMERAGPAWSCPRRSRPSTSGRRRCPTCSRSGSSSRSPSSPARRLCDAIAAGPNAPALSVAHGRAGGGAGDGAGRGQGLRPARAARRRQRRARRRGGLVARRGARAGARHARPRVAAAAGARAPRSGGVGAGRARAAGGARCASRTSPRSALPGLVLCALAAAAGDRRLRARADRAAAAALGPRGRPGGARRRCSLLVPDLVIFRPEEAAGRPRRRRSRRASSSSTTTSCSGRRTRCSTAARCSSGRRRSTASPASTCWRPGSRSRRSATARSGC